MSLTPFQPSKISKFFVEIKVSNESESTRNFSGAPECTPLCNFRRLWQYRCKELSRTKKERWNTLKSSLLHFWSSWMALNWCNFCIIFTQMGVLVNLASKIPKSQASKAPYLGNHRGIDHHCQLFITSVEASTTSWWWCVPPDVDSEFLFSVQDLLSLNLTLIICQNSRQINLFKISTLLKISKKTAWISIK